MIETTLGLAIRNNAQGIDLSRLAIASYYGEFDDGVLYHEVRYDLKRQGALYFNEDDARLLAQFYEDVSHITFDTTTIQLFTQGDQFPFLHVFYDYSERMSLDQAVDVSPKEEVKRIGNIAVTVQRYTFDKNSIIADHNYQLLIPDASKQINDWLIYCGAHVAYWIMQRHGLGFKSPSS